MTELGLMIELGLVMGLGLGLDHCLEEYTKDEVLDAANSRYCRLE
jgi:hypothetical protein